MVKIVVYFHPLSLVGTQALVKTKIPNTNFQDKLVLSTWKSSATQSFILSFPFYFTLYSTKISKYCYCLIAKIVANFPLGLRFSVWTHVKSQGLFGVWDIYTFSVFPVARVQAQIKKKKKKKITKSDYQADKLSPLWRWIQYNLSSLSFSPLGWT